MSTLKIEHITNINRSGEDLSIDTSGNVGIGTANPAKKLHIKDSIPDIRLEDTNTNAVVELRGNTGTGSFVLATDVNNAIANSKIIFEVDNDEKVRIDNNGNVGIGTDSPSQNLHLSSSDHTRLLVTGGTDKYAELQFENDAQKFAIGVQNDDKFFLYNSTGTSQVLTVDTSSNVGIGTQYPIDPLTVGTSTSFDNGDNFVIASFMPATDGGESSGMLFGHYPASGYAKQGIFWERYVGASGSGGRGKLHFVNRDATDTSVPTTADTRMTIDEAGNVGIGNTSPGQLLEVTGSGATIRVESTDNNQQGIEFYQTNTKNASIMWGQGNANLEIKNFRNDQNATNLYANIDFYTGGANATSSGSPAYTPEQAMRITDDQNVIIGGGGQTSEKLLVKTTQSGGGLQIAWSDGSSPGSGQTLGSIGFQGYSNGNSNASADAKIQGVSDGVHSGSSAPSRLEFYTKGPTTGPGSAPVRRLQIGNGGDMLLQSDDNGWSSFYMNESAGIKYHVKRFYANATSVTWDMIRVKRHYWGAGFYKIWVKQQYYYDTAEAWWNLSGYGRNDGSYSPNYALQYNNVYGGMTSSRLQLTTPSASAPGNAAAAYVDVQIVAPAYNHFIVLVEAGAMASFSRDVTSMSGNDMYALHG